MFPTIFRRELPTSRKYVDLILKESCLWPSLRPSRADGVQVGDYGDINEKTGEFEYRGNIYNNESILNEVPELKEAACQPRASAPLSHWIIRARARDVRNPNDESTEGSPEGSDASIDFEVSYDEGRRGAILVMYSPRETNLPNTVPLAKLASAKEMKKNGKVLVTSVVSCPAFTLQVSDATASSFRVRFKGELPYASPLSAIPVRRLDVGWDNRRSGAVYLDGCNLEGNYVYTPLFQLKKRKKGNQKGYRRDKKTSDAGWETMKEPWGLLDEDGNVIGDDGR